MASATSAPEFSKEFTTTLYSNYTHIQKAAERVSRIFGLAFRTPSGLNQLAIWIENPPSGICANVGHLDEIVEGKNIDNHRSSYADGCYFSEFLEQLEWWIRVSTAVLDGAGLESDYGRSYPEQRKKIASMIFAVLDAYKIALLNTMEFCEDENDPDAHIELLRRYRLFTRYICTFAQEVWPGVNMEKLFQAA